MIESLELRRLLSAGDPLENFGIGGLVRVGRGYSAPAPIALAVTRDHKVLVAAANGDDTRGTPDGVDFYRFNADGSFDHTLAGTGQLATFFDQVRAIRPLRDGQFYAFGYQAAENGETGVTWYLARFNNDGSADAAFGNGGRVKVALDTFSRRARPYSPHISAAGQVTLVTSTYASEAPPVLARFGADGAIDRSFGQNGTLPLRTSRASLSSDFRIADDGSIYQSGSVVRDGKVSSSTRFIRKLRPDGTADTRFGGDGYVSVRADLAFTEFVPTGDSLLVVARRLIGTRGYLLKYTATGDFDTSFGNGGAVTRETGTYAYGGVFPQPDGKVILRGSPTLRLNPDGTPDPTWSGGTFPSANVAFDGNVLYSASRGEIYATALTNDAPSYADLAPDGTLTLRGTPGSDHLSAYQGTVIAGDGSGEVYVQRESWGRTFSGVRRVLIDAGSGDDNISGHTSTLPATIAGAAGSDIIRFYGDAPTLIGGGIGDDRINVTGNGYTIDGGPGIDRIELHGDNNTVTGGSGDDSIRAYTFPSNDSPVLGSILRGGDGNDTIITFGRRGDHTFAIFGDAGNDYLRSGFSSDTLTGGPGADTLRSGGGIDIFNTDPDDTFASA